MTSSQSATRVTIPATDVKFPSGIFKFAGASSNRQSVHKSHPHRHIGIVFGGASYWDNRFPPSKEPVRPSASKGLFISVGSADKSKHRSLEPLTPQNSVLSDGPPSERCVEPMKDQGYLGGLSYKPEQRNKKSDSPKKTNKTKAQGNVSAKDNTTKTKHGSVSGDKGEDITSPPATKDPPKSLYQRGKTSDQLNIRTLRWSTSALGKTKYARLGDADMDYEEDKPRRGHRDDTIGLRSEFTFSAYDFYNKHNSGRWFSSTVSKTNDRETSIAELRRKLFSHGRVEEIVKDWAQEAYKTRIVQMLLPEVAREEVEENEPVAPLLAHLKKQSHAEPLPAIFNPMRRGSVPPGIVKRKSSVFYALPSFEHLPEQERMRRRKMRNFRWYSHLIRGMVRLSANMKQLSRDLTHKSAYSEFLYILAGARTHAGQEGLSGEGGGRDKSSEPQLLFDKSWFSRGRARSRMPPWAIEVMSRPPHRRNAQQILHLKHLLATMKSFRENMTDDMRTKMCQVVRYTKCDKGRVVLRQGHVGHDFYFIFSGSVFIQIDIYDPIQEEMKTSVENVLRMGEGFGEIALLGDGHRTASVICKEPTELCQIDKATFLEVCPALFNQLLQDKVNFAREFPLFSPWDPKDLRNLCFLSQVLDVPHSTVIEANWARPDFAYFVMKGRVSMLKEFDVTDIEENARTTRGVQDDTDPMRAPPLPEDESKRKKHTRFANVGTLVAGTHTELSVLSVEPPKDITPIALVSEGARLLRITTRTFRRIAPRKLCEEYLRKTYTRRTFPSEEDLRNLYVAGKSWSAFKATILQTQLLGQSGALLATIPATLKGSSGWCRWPGYAVISSRPNKNHEEAAFDHEEYAHQVDQFHHRGGDFDLDGVYEGETDCEENGYFYDSESSEDPFLRTPVRTPLDDHLDHVKLESDRSFTQDPPKCGSVPAWRKRLPPNVL